MNNSRLFVPLVFVTSFSPAICSNFWRMVMKVPGSVSLLISLWHFSDGLEFEFLHRSVFLFWYLKYFFAQIWWAFLHRSRNICWLVPDFFLPKSGAHFFILFIHASQFVSCRNRILSSFHCLLNEAVKWRNQTTFFKKHLLFSFVLCVAQGDLYELRWISSFELFV